MTSEQEEESPSRVSSPEFQVINVKLIGMRVEIGKEE